MTFCHVAVATAVWGALHPAPAVAQPAFSPAAGPADRPLVGIAMMVIAMSLLPVGDALAKHLASHTAYNAEFLAWSRFAIGSAVIVPVAIGLGLWRGLGPRFYAEQALRGALVAGAITLIIHAVARAPLADAYGAFFIAPILAALFGVVLLKERSSARDWLAIALGFTGVLMVLRPTGEMSEGLLWALGAGGCFACFLVATRWLAGSAPPLAQLAGQLFFGFLFLAPLGAGDLLAHGVVMPASLLAMSAISAGSNLLSILALGRAPAVYLAPVVYVQIVSATLLSWLVFGDVLEGVALAGILLILCGGATRIRYGRARGAPAS